jgi:type II secretory pathway pseudopilin PulG
MILQSEQPRPRRRLIRRERGFTLIEAALTTVIVGTGVLAIVAAQQAYHMKNQWTKRSDTAMLLANEIRERTFSMPLHDPITGTDNLGPEANETTPKAYDDIDDFAGPVNDEGVGSGLTIDPPMNALGDRLQDLDAWSQHVEVKNIDPANISSAIARPLDMQTNETKVMRVTVTVRFNGPEMDQPNAVTDMTWLVTQ